MFIWLFFGYGDTGIWGASRGSLMARRDFGAGILMPIRIQMMA
jgi:hypothetical protein